ncbi:MAG: 16S rRNA (cytosine(1402)-N(4))-methyltransferase RsmH [Betaproteobacteria bacterium]|nr:16S rRNA (cytosine(1402)-N(4))-methyltransferase RsmH [Betaproteobacteria bacterium]
MNDPDTSPAHVTVLAGEATSALLGRVDGVYVDCTFGRGGHARRLLAQLGPGARVIGIDRDPDAIAAGRTLQAADPRFSIHHARFSELPGVLRDAGVGTGTVDGVLADLGVSSPQLDVAGRGFSFAKDGPLDMRMDTTRGESAADWLARATEQEIRGVIRDYGEERFAQGIARQIVAARGAGGLQRTRQLAELVGQAVRTREPGQHPATRTFQAVRIFINRELEEVEALLPQAIEALRPGGKLVVIAFHSLEDRIVKRFMAHAAKADHLPAKLPIRASEVDEATLTIVGKPVKAGAAEVAANPRARSAIMRVAQRRTGTKGAGTNVP